MASPQLEQGFIRLAHELDAAISAAGFGRVEGLILREVRAQCYGRNNHDVARFNLHDLERITGIQRASFRRALRSLFESGVLIEKDGGLKFIKDYESWTVKGKPMLTPELIDFCKTASRRASARIPAEGGCAGAPRGGAHAHPPRPSAYRIARAEFETEERQRGGESTHPHDSISPEDTEIRKAIQSSATVHGRSLSDGRLEGLVEFARLHVEAGHSRPSVLGAIDTAIQKARDISGIGGYAVEILSRPRSIAAAPAFNKNATTKPFVGTGTMSDAEFIERLEANLATIEDA